MSESFYVTATLQRGISINPNTGIGLDSLIASQIRKEIKMQRGISGAELDGGLHARHLNHMNLPLTKCINPNNPQEWHWNTTTGTLLDHHGNEIPLHTTPTITNIIQTRDTHAHEQTIKQLPNNISATAGRWKGHRIPYPTILAHQIRWNAHGNLTEVNNILQHILSIGHRRNTGNGRITHWEATPTPHQTQHTAGHTNPTNPTQLGRPCYDHCLTNLNIPTHTLTTTTTGMRPPYWHHQNQHPNAHTTKT